MTFETEALPDLYIKLPVEMRPFLASGLLNAPDNSPQIILPSSCKGLPLTMNKSEKDPDFFRKLLKQKKQAGGEGEDPDFKWLLEEVQVCV